MSENSFTMKIKLRMSNILSMPRLCLVYMYIIVIYYLLYFVSCSYELLSTLWGGGLRWNVLFFNLCFYICLLSWPRYSYLIDMEKHDIPEIHVNCLQYLFVGLHTYPWWHTSNDSCKIQMNEEVTNRLRRISLNKIDIHWKIIPFFNWVLLWKLIHMYTW